MKVLLSTFGPDDFDRVVQAMKQLPYEQLVLIGPEDASESVTFSRISELELMAGHEVVSETVRDDGFMATVEAVSEIVRRHARDEKGKANELLLNISGGPKLLGDAALFAAFRSGVEAYHCDGRLTKLPVLRGLTAKDRFTPSQVRFIGLIDVPSMSFDKLVDAISPGNRQPVERVMRELRKSGLIETEVKDGKIVITLSDSGEEVARAIKAL